MKVSADWEVCICSGQCARIADAVFDQNDDGLVVLLQEEPPAELHEQVREAAMSCPTGAITIDEDQ